MTRTMTRRTLLALMLGVGAAALSGCRAANASAGAATSGTSAPRSAAGTPTPANSRSGILARRGPALAGAAHQGGSGGRSLQHLTVGGVARRYVRYEPSGLDPATPAPLVLVLHGRGGNGIIAERMYDMSDLATSQGFVVAYPDALGDPPTWNTDYLDRRPTPDDVGFIRALVEQEGRLRAIDPARTYACGHSSGALMSYALAAEASDLFPAVGIVAGSIGFQARNGMTATIKPPPRPVSVIHFHGTEDELIPYDGGPSRGPNPLPGFVGVADSIRFWVNHNGCSQTPTTEQRGASRRETYTGGRDGTDVTLWTVQGGGHGWPKPGSPAGPSGTTAGISATDLIWEFFQGHQRA